MNGMSFGPVTLSTATLLTVIRWRQAEPHPVLADIPTWYDDAALRTQANLASEELDLHALTSGDRLDPDFDDVLGAIIRPDRELYGWINTTIHGRPHGYNVLAGTAYQQGFLLVREHLTDTVRLQAISPADLLESFTAHLPPERPAQQLAITVPYEALHKPEHADARVLQAILTQPRHGAGSLYTAIRRRGGTRVRIPRPINYIDTPQGRWLTELTSANGQLWASAIPAARQAVAARLNRDVDNIDESAFAIHGVA